MFRASFYQCSTGRSAIRGARRYRSRQFSEHHCVRCLGASANDLARQSLPLHSFTCQLTSSLVDCQLQFLPRHIVGYVHDHRPLGSPLRKDGLALPPIQGSAVAALRIFPCGSSSLPSPSEVIEEVDPTTAGVMPYRLRDEELSIRA